VIGHGEDQAAIARGTVYPGMLRTTLLTLAFLGALHAQYSNGRQSVILKMPPSSRRAAVSQRIGMTDITVTYSRPLAGKRKIGRRREVRRGLARGREREYRLRNDRPDAGRGQGAPGGQVRPAHDPGAGVVDGHLLEESHVLG
jgi:hypothetical protein